MLGSRERRMRSRERASFAGPFRVLCKFLVACGVGALSPGCTQILGVDDYKIVVRDMEATSSCGNWAYSSTECAACMDQSCCTAASACQHDPTCNAFGACEAACTPGDAECAGSTCRSTMPFLAGYNSLESLELEACRSKNCSSECGTLRSKSELCGFPLGGSQCGACCCTETATCAKDPECLRAYQCILACNSTIRGSAPQSDRCFTGCLGDLTDAGAANAGSAVSAGLDVWQCVTSWCASSCQGEDWSCIGRAEVPSPSQGPRVADLVVQVFGSPAAPLSGMDVRECLKADSDCSLPLWRGSTDPEGHVSIPILETSASSAGTSPADVYFDVADVQSPPRVVETLVYTASIVARRMSVMVPPPPPRPGPGGQDPKMGSILAVALN